MPAGFEAKPFVASYRRNLRRSGLVAIQFSDALFAFRTVVEMNLDKNRMLAAAVTAMDYNLVRRHRFRI